MQFLGEKIRFCPDAPPAPRVGAPPCENPGSATAEGSGTSGWGEGRLLATKCSLISCSLGTFFVKLRAPPTPRLRIESFLGKTEDIVSFLNLLLICTVLIIHVFKSLLWFRTPKVNICLWFSTCGVYQAFTVQGAPGTEVKPLNTCLLYFAQSDEV